MELILTFIFLLWLLLFILAFTNIADLYREVGCPLPKWRWQDIVITSIFACYFICGVIYTFFALMARYRGMLEIRRSGLFLKDWRGKELFIPWNEINAIYYKGKGNIYLYSILLYVDYNGGRATIYRKLLFDIKKTEQMIREYAGLNDEITEGRLIKYVKK